MSSVTCKGTGTNTARSSTILELKVALEYPPVATVAVRDSYTIRVNSSTLVELLRALQDPIPEVFPQIFGGAIEKLPSGKYLMEFIVGTTDPDNIYSGGAGVPVNPNFDMTTVNQEAALVNILDRLEIRYTVAKVVQVLNTQDITGTPGSFLKSQSALTEAGIPTLTSYSGPAPYVLPPVLCPGSIFGFEIGIQGRIYRVPAQDVARAYLVLLAAATAEED